MPRPAFFIQTVEKQRFRQIYASVSSTILNDFGYYFSDCAEKEPARQAQDDEVAKRLWILSEEMVGMKTTEKS